MFFTAVQAFSLVVESRHCLSHYSAQFSAAVASLVEPQEGFGEVEEHGLSNCDSWALEHVRA